ncbi:hypothetical protein B0J11DRAFT_510630 [Dendryphion nanum]|uniref:Uncharacterized protein n=1 Tax=Dendryphion nanum TaxID=256645 RepID=A0A9P9IBQ8_9PLEO|nr:hypothetical protein B0J11DRAFT_510630 [Dendryphion nanum]
MAIAVATAGGCGMLAAGCWLLRHRWEEHSEQTNPSTCASARARHLNVSKRRLSASQFPLLLLPPPPNQQTNAWRDQQRPNMREKEKKDVKTSSTPPQRSSLAPEASEAAASACHDLP